MQNILIKNGYVLLFEKDDVIIEKKDVFIKDGVIQKIENCIDENNLIYQIEEKPYVIDAGNKIVMPGLINTHAHIPMSIFRETTEGCKLYEWLSEKIWPVESKLTNENVYYASMLSYIEMISTGTTCVNDHYFMSEFIRKAAEEANIRTVLTRVIMDNDGEKALEERINEFKELYSTRDVKNDLITYTVSPHGLYTCSPKALEMCSKLAHEYNLPVHVHFLESIDEIDDIKNKYNEKAIYVLKKYFGDVHTILAHGVKLDDEDIEELKTMDCSIAHNPVSNLRLGCKIADTTKYLVNGINVSLGTDGQGSRK